MPRILFLLGAKDDPEEIAAALREEGCETTPVRDPRSASSLISQGGYDALVLGDPACEQPDPPATQELVRRAQSLHVPVALFPRPDSTLLPRPRADRRGGRMSRRRIERILEEKVRPAFQARGGDVDLVEVRRGGVVLRMMGVCTLCPAARDRHREEIERFLRAEAPELGQVEIEPAPSAGGRWW